MRVVAKVILDSETFKALASPTRLAVLKSLDARRKTVTELSRDLELNKATVHEHLQLLVATGLVKKRDDEGRKWIYYELTWQGERLLHPEETTSFMVLLGLSVAAAGGGVAMLGRALGWWWQEKQVERSAEGPSSDGPMMAAEGSAPSQSGESDQADQGPPAGADQELRARDEAPAADDGNTFFDEDGWIALALVASAILFAVLAAIMRRRKPKTE